MHSISSSSAVEAREQRARRRQHVRAAQELQLFRDTRHFHQCLSPAQQCATDALSVSFSFLPLPELVVVASVCRAFGRAALRVQPLNAHISQDGWNAHAEDEMYRTYSLLPLLAASPYRKHVVCFEDESAFGWDSCSCGAFSQADLSCLAACPRLRRIEALRVGLTEDELSSDCSFSPSLEFASITVSHGDLDEDVWSPVLRGLQHCKSLTELKLCAPEVHQSVNFNDISLWTLTALGQVQSLTRLKLQAFPEIHYTAAVMSTVKQLANLRELELQLPYDDWEIDEAFSLHWLPALCSPPHRLSQLERVSLGYMWLTLEHFEHLAKFPSLKSLQPELIMVEALPGLAHCKQLTELYLPWDNQVNLDFHEEQPLAELGLDPNGRVLATVFLPHLQCSSLTHFSINDAVFTLEEAQQLCNSLPKLSRIVLTNVGWPSLAPLRCIARTLDSFELTPLTAPVFVFSADDVKPLLKLRVLTLLKLTPPMDAASRALLTPPNRLFPSLIEFETT
jgi:hypothetical protein